MTELYNKALSILEKKVFLGNKYQKAHELLEEAAVSARMHTDFQRLALVNIKLAEVAEKLKKFTKTDISDYYRKASGAYQIFAQNQIDKAEADKILNDLDKNSSIDARIANNITEDGSDSAQIASTEELPQPLNSQPTTPTTALPPTPSFVNSTIIGIEEAVSCLDKASKYLADAGKFFEAAKCLLEIGEFCKQIVAVKIVDPSKYLQQAVEFFEMEQKYEYCNNALKLLYSYFVEIGNYEKAAKILEHELILADWNEPDESRGKPTLLRFDINTLIFTLFALKFALIDPLLYTSNEFEKFKLDIDALADMRGRNFKIEREYEYLLNMCKAFEQKDLQLFIRSTKKFNEVKRLDKFLSKLLLKVRKVLEQVIRPMIVENEHDFT